MQRAKKKGAQQAEAFLEVGRRVSVPVRDGEIEDLTQATSKGVGLRVFVKGPAGLRVHLATSSPARWTRFVDRALQLAEAAAPNKLNGLPGKKDLGKPRATSGALFDPTVANLAGDWKIKAALEMEKAGKAVDPRITTFDSVGAGDYVSRGLPRLQRGAVAAATRAPTCTCTRCRWRREGGQLQTSYWVDYKRFLDDLDSPEAIGREAARRAVRMLGAKKVKTPEGAGDLRPDDGRVASSAASPAAANGDAVFKKSSFFAPLLGKKIAPEHVTLVDDGLLRARPGHLALRRRGRAHPAHAHPREGRAEELPLRRVHRAQGEGARPPATRRAATARCRTSAPTTSTSSRARRRPRSSSAR